MKINAFNFAAASATTAAILWLVCSLLVWTMPGAMMTTTGHMVHMDMSRFGWMLSPMGFIWGLVVWSVFAGVFAWLLAAIYNLLNGKTQA
jgi:cell division protein FtsX